jgi:hypothetical protein
LGFSEAGEVTADEDLLQDLWRHGGHGVDRDHGGGVGGDDGRRHGLVLPRQDVIKAGVDGGED